LQTAPLLNGLAIDGIKLHNLHVIKNTVLEQLYRSGTFSLFSREDYVSLVVDFLELLDPGTVIHRLSGETYRRLTVAPDWSVNKMATVSALQSEMERRDAWQGKYFEKICSQSEGVEH
ncbi:MAG: TIGR01212 family radical SAM protein, partial [Candidatus Binatia bacterium]